MKHFMPTILFMCGSLSSDSACICSCLCSCSCSITKRRIKCMMAWKADIWTHFTYKAKEGVSVLSCRERSSIIKWLEGKTSRDALQCTWTQKWGLFEVLCKLFLVQMRASVLNCLTSVLLSLHMLDIVVVVGTFC